MYIVNFDRPTSDCDYLLLRASTSYQGHSLYKWLRHNARHG